MKVLDLFSGIGGMSLGLEMAGMETVAFCEIEEFPRKVLNKHWPAVPVYHDVKELTNERLNADGIYPDVIAGGFPCQDISTAGKQAGIHGNRSGLWSEFKRLIEDVRPKWAVIENVSALRSKGLTLVLQDLWKIGYDAEWHCISASAVGAPHQRDRIWVVAYPSSIRPQGQGESIQPINPTQIEDRQTVISLSGGFDTLWETEPNVGRVANGVPKRMDRLKCLGNAVVPQIPFIIGQAIMQQYN